MTATVVDLADARARLRKELMVKEYISWFTRHLPLARDPDWQGEYPAFDPMAVVSGAPKG